MDASKFKIYTRQYRSTEMRSLILLALVGAAFAVPRSPQRIVGGEPATVEQYPYIANMQRQQMGRWTQVCAGSLITTRSVLSAAHCYHGEVWSSWNAIFGTNFATANITGPNIYQVSQFIRHPQFNILTYDNDVAIVRFFDTVVLSNSIATASIAGPNYNLAYGTPVIAVGWGALYYGGPRPETLQHVTVNIVDLDECRRRYDYLRSQPLYAHYPPVSNSMLCAGLLDEGGQGVCSGDSGGPLLHAGYVVVGLISWGFDCAHETYPGVYTSVAAVSNWIVNNSL